MDEGKDLIDEFLSNTDNHMLDTSISSNETGSSPPTSHVHDLNTPTISSAQNNNYSKRKKYERFRELCREALIQQEKDYLQQTGLLEAFSNFPNKNEIDTAKQDALFEAGQRAYKNYFTQGDAAQHKGRSIYNVPDVIMTIR
jgi:hypothetical protein